MEQRIRDRSIGKAGAGAGRRFRDPMDDYAVFCLDRLLGGMDFDMDLCRACLASLDKKSLSAFSSSLFKGRKAIRDIEALGGISDAAAIAVAVERAVEKHQARIMPRGDADDEPGLSLATVEGELTRAFVACHGKKRLRDPFADRRVAMAAIFGLDAAEIEILCALFCLEVYRAFGGFAATLLQHCDRSEYFIRLALIVGQSPSEVRSLLGEQGRLCSLGLVRKDYIPPPFYGLSDTADRLIIEPDNNDYFVAPFAVGPGSPNPTIYPLESFNVPPTGIEVIEAALRSGVSSVLLFGPPGTGKTSFAASVVERVGIAAFSLSSVNSDDGKESEYARLKAAAHVAASSGGILVVDEAERCLGTEGRRSSPKSGTKSWLAEFMDSQRCSIIWIVNDISCIHDAVKRRFAYSFEFRNQGSERRAVVWRRLIAENDLARALRNDEVEHLSKRYDVSSGGISLALKSCKAILSRSEGGGEGPSPSPADVLHEILDRHEALMTGESAQRASDRACPKRLYVPDAINVDVSLDRLVEGLSAIAADIRRKPAGPRDEGPREAKLLFHGAPGTGKTAFARYLAERLDLELSQLRASDIVSPFVGMTESNIARAFAAAEESGALLLIDEADSLFIDRRNARASWERSQTNELLTRMEDFEGILVCCTNQASALDPAALRRFQWKIAFKPPTFRYRVELYERYFTGLAGPADEAARSRLEPMDELCPGDFAAVYKALACLYPRGDRGGTRPSHDGILDRLGAELDYRSASSQRRIGFGPV